MGTSPQGDLRDQLIDRLNFYGLTFEHKKRLREWLGNKAIKEDHMGSYVVSITELRFDNDELQKEAEALLSEALSPQNKLRGLYTMVVWLQLANDLTDMPSKFISHAASVFTKCDSVVLSSALDRYRKKKKEAFPQASNYIQTRRSSTGVDAAEKPPTTTERPSTVTEKKKRKPKPPPLEFTALTKTGLARLDLCLTILEQLYKKSSEGDDASQLMISRVIHQISRAGINKVDISKQKILTYCRGNQEAATTVRALVACIKAWKREIEKRGITPPRKFKISCILRINRKTAENFERYLSQ